MKENEDGDAIEDLVFEFFEACEASESSPSKVLDTLCDAHPRDADELRAAVERITGLGVGLAATSLADAPREVAGYRLLDRLGAGGMGFVYRAAPNDGGPEVALKLLHPHLQSEPEALERFAREAEAIARLDHPGIVRVHDHGEFTEGGLTTPYLAMALHRGAALDLAIGFLGRTPVDSADGNELGARLHTSIAPEIDPLSRSSRLRGPWWQVVARIGADLASALAHAHESGVVHRDVKPSNVLVRSDGRALLLDFGLAVMKDAGRLTRSGAQLGSLPYMAPEQVAGRTIDAAVDVYGLGLVLYELLTLQPAFGERNPDALAVAIERGASFRPSRVVPWIPASVATSVDAVVERATQANPAERYPTARALADDLEALANGRPLSIEPISSMSRALRTARRYPWQIAICAVVVVFALVGALVLSIYEERIATDARADIANEIASIERSVDALRSGFVTISNSPLGDDPKFAPTALSGMIESRDQMITARQRLRELEASGEDVSELALSADRLIADVLIGIANGYSTIGDMNRAIPAYRAHVAHMERMVEEWTPPGEVTESRIQSEFGRSLGMLARALHLSDVDEDALDEATRSVELLEDVAARGETPERTARQLIGALLIKSEALLRADDPAGAAAALDRAELESIAVFGEAPRDLEVRGKRGEIELRRVRNDFIGGGRPNAIAALQRSIEWFDGGDVSVSEDAVLAIIRLEAGRRLATHLRLMERFDEAQACVDDVRRIGRGIVAGRGEKIGPDDPFVHALEDVDVIATLIEADRASDAERVKVIDSLRETFEAARTEYGENPTDLKSTFEYLRTAGIYTNQAAMRRNPDPAQLEHVLEIIARAIEDTDDQDESVPQLYAARQLCHYAYGLALVRAERWRDADRAVDELEAMAKRQSPVDGAGLRYAADLTSELLVSNLGMPMEPQLRERTLSLLEAAVDHGFDDLDELETTEALDPIRVEPRFAALIERIKKANSGD